MGYSPDARESSMAQDYVHPLQALRAVMVQRRRTLAESLLRSRKGAKAAKRRKKLIKLQRELDVIDDAIADEQLLSPSLREQVAKERTGEDKVTSSVDTAAEPIELVRARLTALSERLTETGWATVSKTGAR
jgi:hypothetical protein